MTIDEQLDVCEAISGCRMLGCRPEHDDNNMPLSCRMLRHPDRTPLASHKRFTEIAAAKYPAALRALAAIRKTLDAPRSDELMRGMEIKTIVDSFERGEE